MQRQLTIVTPMYLDAVGRPCVHFFLDELNVKDDSSKMQAIHRYYRDVASTHGNHTCFN